MTEHFEKPGKDNTDRCIELALARAKELGINQIVAATNSGWTIERIVEKAQGMEVIGVALYCGSKEPFKMELASDKKAELAVKGVLWVSGPHALSGVERAISTKFGGLSPAEVSAHTLRIFGQGTKVCVEITIMAADAGALSGQDIIAIGGTGKGADTACVIKPVHAKSFFDMRVREIICKPRRT